MCFNNIWGKNTASRWGREEIKESTKRGKQEKNGDPKCNYC